MTEYKDNPCKVATLVSIKVAAEYINIWKLNKSLSNPLNNGEIKTGIGKYIKTNKNGNRINIPKPTGCANHF